MRYTGQWRFWGPPGTGKTTKLASIIEEILADSPIREDGTSPVVVCSLTRSAAAELVRRQLPVPKAQRGTLHSLCYHALGSPVIAEAKVAKWNEEYPEWALPSGLSEDVDDLVFEPVQRSEAAKIQSEYILLRSRMVERDLWPNSVLAFAAQWEDWKRRHGLLDFADLIEQTLKKDLPPPGAPDIIIGDEAQDYDALEIALLQRWSQKAKGLILAGDPDQSIYVWRGADPQLFFSGDVPADQRRLLNRSYRLPRAVLRVALAWRAQLSDSPAITYEARTKGGREVEGECRTVPYTFGSAASLVSDARADLAAGRRVMIAASCGYMLREVISELRNQGVPFANPWRRRRGDWNPLRAGRGTSIAQRLLAFVRVHPASWSQKQPARVEWTASELASWVAALKADGVLLRGAKGVIEQWKGDELVPGHHVQELFEPEAWKQIWEIMADSRPVEEALQWYEARVLPSRARTASYAVRVASEFGLDALQKEPKLYVGTIHSFKGAEADSVYLCPDLSPSAVRAWQCGDEAARNEVVRVFYVGITRARERLTICEAGGPHVDLLEEIR